MNNKTIINTTPRLLLHIISYMSAFLFIFSCSIKENRDSCPCWLNLDFKEESKNDILKNYSAVNIKAWNKQVLVNDTIKTSDFAYRQEYSVPRGQIQLSIFKYKNNIKCSNNIVTIEKGKQADSLYAYNSKIYCLNDYIRETVILHKQFTTISIDIKTSDGSKLDKNVLIKSNVCGMDMNNLSPLEGEFEYSPNILNNTLIFRVPRQKDNSMRLFLIDKTTKKIDCIFPLGEQIVEHCHYDWSMKDLQDISLELNYTNATLTDKVNKWIINPIYNCEI